MSISGLNRKTIAWALYDWANSAFALSVLAVLFPLFLGAYWSAGDPGVAVTSRLTWATAIASVIVFVIAPVIGAIGDSGGYRKRFLLLFGGSFAFGEGVGQRETLAFYIGELAPGVRPYNYGFHGYGPPHLLARVEAGGLRQELEEPSGWLVYLLIDSHVNRAIGSMVVYSGWSDTTPFYAPDEAGVPRRRGSFTPSQRAVWLRPTSA